ncbi:hypothetical protein TNCV_967561 [Trichonephila clavipes]|nr:hypothetical protein TNCV_967561 [Trichonephila clavipes]
MASGMSITEYLSLIGTYLLIRILKLRAELMGLLKLNLKDLNKWAETILVKRRQTKSVGRWISLHFRDLIGRGRLARREVSVEMDWVDPKINDRRQGDLE